MPLGSKAQPCFTSALRTWVKVTFFPGLPNTQDLLQRLQAEAPGEQLQAMARQWVAGKALVNNTHRRISSLPDTLCPLSWLWQPQNLKYSRRLSVLLLIVSSLPLASHLEAPPPFAPIGLTHLPGVWPFLIQPQRVDSITGSQKEAIPILVQVHDLEV